MFSTSANIKWIKQAEQNPLWDMNSTPTQTKFTTKNKDERATRDSYSGNKKTIKENNF